MSENSVAAGTYPAGSAPAAEVADATPGAETTTFAIILSLSFCHLLNDMMQSMVPAIYPILKDSHHLDFAQIGLDECGVCDLCPTHGDAPHPAKRKLPFRTANVRFGSRVRNAGRAGRVLSALQQS